MICDDDDSVWGALKILIPFIKSKNDSKKFSVIDDIVSFCWSKCLREICAGMEIAINIWLHEYCSCSKK